MISSIYDKNILFRLFDINNITLKEDNSDSYKYHDKYFRIYNTHSLQNESQFNAVYNEDKRFIEYINGICDANADEQKILFNNSTKNFKYAFIDGVTALNRLQLTTGMALMHENTFSKSLNLNADEIGYDLQTKRFKKGCEDEDTFMGTKIITTIEDTIVPENVIYFFTEPDLFCEFFKIQEADSSLSEDPDEMNCNCICTFNINNQKGVIMLTGDII